MADVASILAVIAGPDGIDPECVPIGLGDPRSVRVEDLRVAVVDEPGMWAPAPSTRAAVAQAEIALRAVGATIVGPVAPHLDQSFDITKRYWQRSERSGRDADRQLRDWDRFTGRLTRAATAFDVVIGPVVADVAPLHRDLRGDDYISTLA